MLGTLPQMLFSVEMTTQDATSRIAANHLAAGSFFLCVKMTIQSLTSFVAAIQLATGAFFDENDYHNYRNSLTAELTPIKFLQRAVMLAV